MLGLDLAFEPFNMLENAELVVAEDGHSPLNRYGNRRSSLKPHLPPAHLGGFFNWKSISPALGTSSTPSASRCA